MGGAGHARGSGSSPLRVDAHLVLPPGELDLSFARSGGPGGQNVNKVETRVLLRFSVERSRALDERQRARLRERLGSRLTAGGDLLVRSDRHRNRARNIQEARRRLAGILAGALRLPKPRRPTSPPRAAAEGRLESKRRRSRLKRDRSVGEE